MADVFDRTLQRLSIAFERLRQFSADVSHELRTPLGNLRGEAEIALAKPRSREAYRRAIESMLEETLRVERIVDSLLFLARCEQQRTPITLAPTDLKTVVTSVVDYYAPVAEQKGVALTYQGTVSASGDPDLLRRALANLVANAIQYTPEGGTVTVDIDPGDPIALRVTDNGCGIAAEHLPKLFDRLYRADPARVDAAQGSGLGLSIVDSIMTLHGEHIAVTSQPSVGTTITLTLASRFSS